MLGLADFARVAESALFGKLGFKGKEDSSFDKSQTGQKLLQRFALRAESSVDSVFFA